MTIPSDKAKNRSESDTVLARIKELELVARTLEPQANDRNEIAAKSLSYVNQFVDSLPQSKAYVAGDCRQLRTMRVGEEGEPFPHLLEILRTEIDHDGVNTSSGTNFAYIQSGGIWASSIADMLAAATNRYAGVYFASPGAVIVENQMIQWLCTLVGYPSTAHGNLSSGGSIANLTAIQTARDSFGINSTNVQKAVVYCTEHAHHCIHKALHTTGLGEAILRTVPMNSRYQMDADALGKALSEDAQRGLRPFLVIATAGTTDTGAVDPLDRIADLCQAFNAWFHVDAAYGGFFVMLKQRQEKFRGIERSDSVVMDPHKGLFLPFGIGVVLVKKGSALHSSYSHEAAYMQDTYGHDVVSPADAGPELTKHFRGLRMWLPLHLYGLGPFRAGLEEKVLLSKYFHDEIGKLGFETGPEPDLSISLFRFAAKDRDDFNRKLLASLRDDGRCFFSSTTIRGELWIRCAVLSCRTHLQEIQIALRVIAEKVQELR